VGVFSEHSVESWGYQMVKKLLRFDTIPASVRQTDRQTRCSRKDPY